MALEITNKNNTFEIKGILNKTNVEKFQNHFKEIFSQSNSILLNINGLKSVDKVGVIAFEELYLQSLKSKKPFYITGQGCRDMFEHLKSLEAVNP
ncbi:MAG: STAS domain-containing protein [Oceanihabitans sp.]